MSRFASAVMVLLLMLPLCAVVATPDDLPQWVLDLSRIQRAMRDELKSLPNYTCSETIDRFGPKKADQIKVNVAVAGGKELYALPGRNFQEQSLASLVQGGFISDGDFAGMAQNIFSGKGVAITFQSELSVEGRRALRYAFEIPLDSSNWIIRQGGASASVATRGSFVADASTFDFLSMQFAAQDLPVWLEDKSLEESVRYERVSIAGHAVLLPKSAEIRAETFDGRKYRNVVTFDTCHQYGSQSTITFETEPPH